MFRLADEIADARYQNRMKASGPLAHDHGLHAFVFLSFIVAEARESLVTSISFLACPSGKAQSF
jgi:hypothetical protein